MQTITKYLADDGTEHATADACRGWENAKRSATEAMSPLGPDRDIRHGRYVQHELSNINQAKMNLLREMRLYHVRWPWNGWGDDDSIKTGHIVGRYIDDDKSPFSDSWYRLMRISFATGREYDQPYFANHEDEATGENA